MSVKMRFRVYAMDANGTPQKGSSKSGASVIQSFDKSKAPIERHSIEIRESSRTTGLYTAFAKGKSVKSTSSKTLEKVGTRSREG